MIQITPSDGPRTAKWLRNLSVTERMKLRGLPRAYREASLEDCIHPAAADVRLYAENFGSPLIPKGHGLRLVGPSGAGKSYLAAAVLKHIVQNNKVSGAWCSTRMYLDLVRADLNEGLIEAGYNDPYSLLYMRRRYDVLVLDGLGQERRTPQSDSIIHELLRDRDDEQFTTIITTTLPMKAIEDRYGEDCAAFLARTTEELVVRGR